MLLQELWIAGVDWDEPVPTELSEKLRKWIAQFDLFSSIRVPRNLCDQNAIAKTLMFSQMPLRRLLGQWSTCGQYTPAVQQQAD